MKVILGEILSHNQGDTMTTIQQLLNEKFSNKIPSSLGPVSPPPALPMFPVSPLFPQKNSSSSLPHTSFTNNIAAAASAPRFSPYHYNR